MKQFFSPVTVVIAFLLFIPSLLFGQTRTCATHELHLERLEADPKYADRIAQREARLQALLRATAGQRALCPNPVILPIAVHYQGVSNPDPACLLALAQSQIQVLNDDFQGLNADLTLWTNGTAANYPGVQYGETCVQFVLATQNHPAGFGLVAGDPAVTINQTSGDSDAAWANYLNIFVRNISALGYVQSIGGTGLGDGMTIDNNAFGSGAGCSGVVPSGNFNLGRTLTHEMGHYLNLRHIWGDGGCTVDDFVADTPASDDSNGGCPGTNTINCGSLDLYMNYMDYTNDACMYMYTAGQASRMDAHVAANLQNVVNNTAAYQPPSPAIAFTTTLLDLAEGTSPCTGAASRTVDIGLEIATAPSAAATVTLTPSGTATLGADYTLSSTTVSFAAGQTASQTVTLTVLEDAAVEADEQLVLTLTVNANGGDAEADPTAQSLTVNFRNDDQAPSIGQPTTLLAQDFNNGLGNWTVTAGGNTPDTWFVKTDSDNLDGTPYLIADSDAAGNGSSMVATLRSPTFDGTAVSNPTLSFDQFIRVYGPGTVETFEVDIRSNGVWQNVYSRDENDGSIGDWGNPDAVSLALTTYAATDNQLRFVYTAAYDWYWAIDNVTVTGLSNTSVQTSTNSSGGFADYDFGPNQTVHYYDPVSGAVMASLTNTSTHDYGCTRVEVDRAATAAPGATASTAAGAQWLTEKTLLVTPELNNSSGSYSISLYYTAAEINGWAAATGLPVADLQLVKSVGAMGTANNVSLAPATVTTLGTDFVYTASFNTGFSGFALGNAGNLLPVELLSFTATAAEDIVQLNWATATEFQNAGFTVERSSRPAEGFSPIGWVTGAGTSERPLTYAFTDAAALPAQTYYYRLRQEDFDGTIDYSPVRSARLENGVTPDFTVSPNPARTTLRIQPRGFADDAVFTLYRPDGTRVSGGPLTDSTRIDVSALVPGVYLAVLTDGRQQQVRRVLIE